MPTPCTQHHLRGGLTPWANHRAWNHLSVNHIALSPLNKLLPSFSFRQLCTDYLQGSLVPFFHHCSPIRPASQLPGPHHLNFYSPCNHRMPLAMAFLTLPWHLFHSSIIALSTHHPFIYPSLKTWDTWSHRKALKPWHRPSILFCVNWRAIGGF